MYAFLIEKQEARIKPEDDYDFFTYQGPSLSLPYRTGDVVIKKDQRFGVRKSSNKKLIRLVLDNNVSKVFTIDLDIAKKLSKHIKPEA